MKDIYDMKIGESFYLKITVATISKRTGKACEFDEERIDINDLVIKELEKIKEEMIEKHNKEVGIIYKSILTMNIGVIDKHISELKGGAE